MENKLSYQCFICKKRIQKSHFADPCAVIIVSNIDVDELDRKEQTFFCHYECFREVNNDDNSMYLESLSTPREVIEEKNEFQKHMQDLMILIESKSSDDYFWTKLFQKPKGVWFPLNSITNNMDKEIIFKLNELGKYSFEILIMWVEDQSTYAKQNDRKKQIVFISDDAHSANFHIIKRDEC